ncbi:MAG: AMP-binding protein [Gemmatimonadetes bacterium]|nr:AMP-binding protein [Gemmatimonadota bacterium]
MGAGLGVSGADPIERANAKSGRPFCFFGDEVITFGALERAVNRLAGGLARAGIASGNHVAVLLPNHPDHIVTILALARLGAVHVPVNIHLKEMGLRHILEHARVDTVVADACYQPELRRASQGLSRIQHLIWRGGGSSQTANQHALAFENLAAEEHPPPPVDPDPDRLIAIMYTSGTTGPPKGVMLTERMYHAAARGAAHAAGVRPGDVLFLWEPLYHITGVQAIVLCLQQGVPCALVERFSASAFWDQVRRYRATQIHYLGGVLSILMKQPQRPDDADNPARIAWGAAAPPDLWPQFERRFGVEVRECYGLTEGASFTTVNVAGKVGSVGTPVDHFEVRIVDEADRPLPPNQIGEIVQREREPGVLMRGYFDDPDGTRAALRDGWLHTGDLGYQDEAGLFYYAGRQKDSIRTRGENVSAWEIEQVVIAYPGVEECAVIGVPSALGESDIKLFIRKAAGPPIEPLEVIRWCEERLAYFQLPRFIALVDDFPRTASHRIRKDELPRSVDDCWDLERSGYRVPRTR